MPKIVGAGLRIKEPLQRLFLALRLRRHPQIAEGHVVPRHDLEHGLDQRVGFDLHERLQIASRVEAFHPVQIALFIGVPLRGLQLDTGAGNRQHDVLENGLDLRLIVGVKVTQGVRVALLEGRPVQHEQLGTTQTGVVIAGSAVVEIGAALTVRIFAGPRGEVERHLCEQPVPHGVEAVPQRPACLAPRVSGDRPQIRAAGVAALRCFRPLVARVRRKGQHLEKIALPRRLLALIAALRARREVAPGVPLALRGVLDPGRRGFPGQRTRSAPKRDFVELLFEVRARH